VRIVKIASAADHQGGVAFATHPGRPIGRRIAAQTGESRSKAGLVAKRELLARAGTGICFPLAGINAGIAQMTACVREQQALLT
jgi:hypothetical protein